MSFKSIPNEVYPIQGGDPSKASFMHLQRMQAEQAAMSRKFSGGRSRSRRSRGGSGPALITIPSFPSGGTKVSPFDANSASLNSNRTLIGGLSQAQNDCYATGTCLAKGGGRRHKSRRHKSRRHKSRRHKSRRNKSRRHRKTRTK
jgi:hypothetical protein